MKSEGRKRNEEGRNQKSEARRLKAGGGERTRTKRARLNAKNWGLRFTLVAGLVCLLGLSFAQNGIGRQSDPGLTLKVRVYNYSPASAAMVEGAEREAGRILSDAGVQAIWLDCLAVDSSTESQSLCHESFGATAVVLRILAKPAENRFRDTVFGFANVPTLASVYYRQAVLLAHGDDADFEATPILGCAIAHEIGHLLLGSNSHSDTGIMRGQWGRKDVQQALMGERLFTPAQANFIRAEVQRREAPQKVGTPQMDSPGH